MFQKGKNVNRETNIYNKRGQYVRRELIYPVYPRRRDVYQGKAYLMKIKVSIQFFEYSRLIGKCSEDSPLSKIGFQFMMDTLCRQEGESRDDKIYGLEMIFLSNMLYIFDISLFYHNTISEFLLEQLSIGFFYFYNNNLGARKDVLENVLGKNPCSCTQFYDTMDTGSIYVLDHLFREKPGTRRDRGVPFSIFEHLSQKQ